MSSTASQPEFIRRQYEFAAHIRDPKANPAPADVEDRRMGIYRDLFFNNVQDFLSNSFPVLRAIYGDEGWELLMRDYFARHESHTPLFLQMPQEFLRYLEEERGEGPGDPPFLYELAHYEWVELALDIDTRDIDLDGIDPGADLLSGRPAVSPLAWPLVYRFPVHRLGPDFLPSEAPVQPTYIVVYRNRHDDVRFLELNPVSARLLDLLLGDETLTGDAALRTIAGELAHPEPAVVIQGGAAVLEDLRARDIILGARA